MFKKFFGAVFGIAMAAVVAFNVVPVVNTVVDNLTPKKVLVVNDPGGSIFQYFEKYNTMRAEGTYLQVDGICASACTFFLGLLDSKDYCVSTKSILGFHGVYANTPLGPIFNKAFSEWVRDNIYNGNVVDFLKAKGFDFTQDVNTDQHPLGLIWATGQDVKAPVCG